MNNYLNNIVARSLNAADVIQPRLPLLFEPSGRIPERQSLSSSLLETEATEEPRVKGVSARRSRAIPQALDNLPGTTTAMPEAAVAETTVTTTAIQAAQSSLPRAEKNELPSSAEATRKSIVQPAQILTTKATASHAASDSPAPTEFAETAFESLDEATNRLREVNLNQSSESPARLLVQGTTGRYGRSENALKEVTQTRETSATNTPGSGQTRPAEILGPITPQKVAVATREDSNFASSTSSGTFSALEQTGSQAVRITIGRVDVRAIMPQPAPATPPRARPKPGLSLEDYLKQRQEGKR